MENEDITIEESKKNIRDKYIGWMFDEGVLNGPGSLRDMIELAMEELGEMELLAEFKKAVKETEEEEDNL